MKVSRQSATKPLSHFKLATAGAATLFLAYFAFDALSRRQIVRATLYGVGAIFPGWVYFSMMKGAGRQQGSLPSPAAPTDLLTDSSTSPSSGTVAPKEGAQPAALPAARATDPLTDSSNSSTTGPSSSSGGNQRDRVQSNTILLASPSIASPSYPTSPSQPKGDNPDYWLYLRKLEPEIERSLAPRLKKFRDKVKDLIDTGLHQGAKGEKGDGFLHAIANLILIYYPQQSRWDREYPEMTSVDTCTNPRKYSCQILYHLADDSYKEIIGCRLFTDSHYFAKEKSAFLSAVHQPSFSYFDDEIIEVIAPPHHTRSDGKRPLFQSGQRGCCGATGAMIASDLLGRECEVIKGLNLDTSDRIARDLESFGLDPIRSEVSSLDELRQKLEEHHCSAQVCVESCGAHVIIVDSVQKDRVEIRDPYHGWAVALKVEAFMRSWRSPGYHGPSVIYQARRRDASPSSSA